MRTMEGYCFGGPLDGRVIAATHDPMRALLPDFTCMYALNDAEAGEEVSVATTYAEILYRWETIGYPVHEFDPHIGWHTETVFASAWIADGLRNIVLKQCQVVMALTGVMWRGT